jgi:hypothetical protein
MSLAGIIRKDWKHVAVPDKRSVVTMLLEDERKLLYYLASEYAQDRGCIIDAGCFLGGSTTALGLGVVARQERAGHPSQNKIHSYDRFEAEKWTIGSLLPPSFQPKQSFRSIFDENIQEVASLVQVHQGDILSQPWGGGPIELLFIDCAKHWIISDFITYHFFKSLIPGHSIVIQQDYLWDSWNAWIHITMEYYSDYFRLLTHTGTNSVVFLYERKIPFLSSNLIGSMHASTKLVLMRRARARFERPQKDYLERSHLQYLTGKAWPNGVDAEGHNVALRTYSSLQTLP